MGIERRTTSSEVGDETVRRAVRLTDLVQAPGNPPRPPEEDAKENGDESQSSALIEEAMAPTEEAAARTSDGDRSLPQTNDRPTHLRED